MSLRVKFYGKRNLSNKFKHDICRYILKGCCGESAVNHYLHFEIMDYNQGLFIGFVVVGRKLFRRIKRFYTKIVSWPDAGRPFTGRDEFFRLSPGKKFIG